MSRTAVCLCLLVLLAACSGGSGDEPSAGGSVQPYRTLTPSRTASVIPVLTQVLLPTPTPYIYTIRENDTISGIASRFGISQEALLAANPGVQPNTLSIGQNLIIPTGSEIPGEPTPTPAPVAVTQVRCWPESGGGLWCFGLVKNEYGDTLENLSARISLLDEQDSELAAGIAYGLLDILPPGASMPLAYHFVAPIDPLAVPRLQVLTAIRLLPGDTRYLPVQLTGTLVAVDAGGRTATVSGQAVLTRPGTAESLWVLATAYDADGNVVGLRRWEATEPISDQAALRFEFLLASLGAPIERVEFLAEARP
jgi:LysM repeat protein